MLYIGPFKMVPYNFLFMQHNDFIYSVIWERGIPPCWVPTNKATGHPRWQNVNKRKNNGVTKPGRWQWYAVEVSCSKCCKIVGSG